MKMVVDMEILAQAGHLVIQQPQQQVLLLLVQALDMEDTVGIVITLLPLGMQPKIVKLLMRS
jgi:hypothetical protein